jgi:hypothetical protein
MILLSSGIVSTVGLFLHVAMKFLLTYMFHFSFSILFNLINGKNGKNGMGRLGNGDSCRSDNSPWDISLLHLPHYFLVSSFSKTLLSQQGLFFESSMSLWTYTPNSITNHGSPIAVRPFNLFWIRCILNPHLSFLSIQAGYLDSLTSTEFVTLTRMVEGYVIDCETICGRQSHSLRATLLSQAKKFIERFHEERRNKLG